MLKLSGKKYQVAGKQTYIFFLLPTASSFLITSLSGWGGGDAHGQGGDAHGGEGGCTCILCIPPGYATDRKIRKK